MQQSLFSYQYNNLEELLDSISTTTIGSSRGISAKQKIRYAQYFTPMEIAKQMAAMLLLPDNGELGDHGAGTGILAATVLAYHYHHHQGKAGNIRLNAYEIDTTLHPVMREVLGRVNEFARHCGAKPAHFDIQGDFTTLAEEIFGGERAKTLDSIILNPPYKKLNQQQPLAKLFRAHGVAVPNLYALFIVLSVLMLRQGGELVAIVPRSFCNGPYFRSFRQWLRRQGSIDWLVRYKRRSNLFRGDNVLQENVIFRFRRGVAQGSQVRISLCDTPETPPLFEALVPMADIFPGDSEMFYVPGDHQELNALHAMRQLPYSFDEAGLTIATGKLEDFRLRDYLSWRPADDSGKDWAPVVYSQHWRRDEMVMRWDPDRVNKPCYLARNAETTKKLVPAGTYILIKRISANDDSSGRCHPCLVTPESIPGDYWAIDNHIQVIAGKYGCLDREQGLRLTKFLGEEMVNNALKAISGTTQINCNDIKQLRFVKELLIE